MLDQSAGTKLLLGSWPGLLGALVLASLSVWLLIKPVTKAGGKVPDSLPDWVPGLGNAYRFVFHNMDFVQYARDNLKGRTIVKFWLGPKGMYLVTGAENAQSVLRNSGNLTSDELFFMALKQLDAVEPQDIEKFKADKSGRSHVPASKVGPEGRIWEPNHRIFIDNLTPPRSVGTISEKFIDLFSATLEKFPKGQSKTMRLYKFLQQEMGRCAIISLSGEEILRQNPAFIDAMWEFDAGVYPLAFGVPRLIYPKVYRARDAYNRMGQKFLTAAWEKFDWDGPDEDADWEPIFGTRFHRTHAKFLKDKGFSLQSRSGMHIGTIWALNANTTPVTCWALIEIIRDKALLRAIRAEATTALVPSRAGTKLDISKLRELPLLQSVYTEVLRMHVAINIVRNIEEDMTLDGYTLKKGYLVNTPSLLSHFDGSIWSDPGHPTNEFWAERHITYIEKVDESGNKITVPQFSITGRLGGFFPFGGGVSICPGRHFAKQEIMATVALILLTFDIELEEYVKMDGSKSDRGPKDDPWYCGTAAMPPDRDMKLRWTKV